MSSDIRMKCLELAARTFCEGTYSYAPDDVVFVAEGFARYVEHGELEPFKAASLDAAPEPLEGERETDDDTADTLVRANHFEIPPSYNDELGIQPVAVDGKVGVDGQGLAAGGKFTSHVDFDAAHDRSTRLGFGGGQP